MTGSMYAAIAGLRTHMQNLNVIGNNVANVNTQGYKASRSVFKTSLYTSLSGGSNGTQVMGGTNPSQIGYGANVSSVDIDMSTGNYSVTGISTDLMLDGAGFFLVGDKTIADTFQGDAQDVGKLSSLNLTRVGNFEFKADGYFCNNDGYCVYGFQTVGVWGDGTAEHSIYYCKEDDQGNLVYTKADGTDLGPNDPPVRRDDIPIDVKEGDPFFSDQLVPIRLPQVRTVDKYYHKTDTGALEEISKGDYDTAKADPDFDESQYVVQEGWDIVYPEAGPSGINSDIVDDATGNPYAKGQFQLITIDKNTGLITGVSNETKEVVTIGCVAVGMVTNPNGVTNLGDNYYKAGKGSGELTVAVLGGNAESMNIKQINGEKYMGADPNDPTNIVAGNPPTIEGLRPRTGGETKMLSSGLEMSKTDLAQEIVNMILTQRGYQANTRIITVTDSMLEELVNMKR